MAINIFSKKISKIVLIIIIFGLLIFLNPKNFFDGVRSPIFKLVYFFEKVFQISAENIHSASSTVASIGSLKRDNESLSVHNTQLVAENAQLKKVREENEMLRKQLELLPREELVLENAEVISQGSHGLNDWIVINKGSKNGIDIGMPVIVLDKVMIGKVHEVLPGSSKIILITNTDSAVNAVTADTNAKGVVKGEYGTGLILDMVLETSKLKVGDQVITSGISDTSEGFLIGRINEIRSSDDYLFQQAVISSPVDLARLRFVSVVVGSK